MVSLIPFARLIFSWMMQRGRLSEINAQSNINPFSNKKISFAFLSN